MRRLFESERHHEPGRIYGSEALRRDEEDPFVPRESEEDTRAMIDWENASHALLPTGLRARAVDVSVQTSKEVYGREEPVQFAAVFENRLPFPVSLKTTTPEPWTWAIDDVEQASRVLKERPADPSLFRFSRSERKTFSRNWPQRIRESREEWSRVPSGEYTLSVRINASKGADRLTAETTFRIE